MCAEGRRKKISETNASDNSQRNGAQRWSKDHLEWRHLRPFLVPYWFWISRTICWSLCFPWSVRVVLGLLLRDPPQSISGYDTEWMQIYFSFVHISSVSRKREKTVARLAAWNVVLSATQQTFQIQFICMIFNVLCFIALLLYLKNKHWFRWLLHSKDAITSAFHLMWRSPLAMENLIKRKIQKFNNPLMLALSSLNKIQQLNNI